MKHEVSEANDRLFSISAGPVEVRESDKQEDEQSSHPDCQHLITLYIIYLHGLYRHKCG
jgi:hypothetical protein